MARTPSMTMAEAEALLGPRGHLIMTKDNRNTARKWVVANGYPAVFVAGLSQRELQNAYNQLNGEGLDAISRKLAEAEENGLVNHDDIVPPAAPVRFERLRTHITPDIEVCTSQLPGSNDIETIIFGGIDDGRTWHDVTAATATERHHLVVADVKAALELDNKLPAPQVPGIENNAPAGFPVAPTPAPNAHDRTAIQILQDLILQGYKPGLDENKVRSIVQDQLAGIKPRVIEVRHDDKPPIKIEGLVHPEFERALGYLSERGPNGYNANVMLVGPAGCGKSHMINQLAKALGVADHTVISCTAGTTEGDLIGRLLPVGEHGRFEYIPSKAIKLYETGNALIAFDEMSGLDPNMGMVANMPLANGSWYVHLRHGDPEVARGENVYFMATDNTYGTGANPLYVGRNQMDEATRDRFIFITVDYDKRLEESIAAAGGLSAAEMAGIWELRDRCREAQLLRVISTRAFQKAAVMKARGESWREIRDRLLEGWSKDEKAKVGV